MTDHVWINGKRHQIVDLPTLDRLVFPDCLVELPPSGAGWATAEVTTEVGTALHVAAWLDWAEVSA